MLRSSTGMCRRFPPAVTVTSATITLNITTTSKDTYQIYELKQNWTEAGATWNRYSATNTWSTAGGQGGNDRGTTVLGTVTASKKGLLTISLNAAGIARGAEVGEQPGDEFWLHDSELFQFQSFCIRFAGSNQSGEPAEIDHRLHAAGAGDVGQRRVRIKTFSLSM